MEQYLEKLSRCPLFEGIHPQNLLIVLNCLGARVERFTKKQTIFSEGTPARQIGILLSGSAQIVQNDYYGNRSLIDEVIVGEAFGEAFACAGMTALPVTILAHDPCEVLLLESEHVLHTCDTSCIHHRRLIFNLMKVLATKTILVHQRIEITSKRTTREKLLTYLALQAKRNASNSFRIPFDRQELADYLEVDRSGLSSEIGKLRREGILLSQKNHFTLL